MARLRLSIVEKTLNDCLNKLYVGELLQQTSSAKEQEDRIHLLHRTIISLNHLLKSG